MNFACADNLLSSRVSTPYAKMLGGVGVCVGGGCVGGMCLMHLGKWLNISYGPFNKRHGNLQCSSL